MKYGGFDPLFWLHHSMIDRVLWLFQNNRGGWQVNPQSGEQGMRIKAAAAAAVAAFASYDDQASSACW
jgi:hypothetical protein